MARQLKFKPHENPVIRFAQIVFDVLCSLKLAVALIVSLTASLIVATVLESAYDTQTAQYWVYRSLWFHGVLFVLGLLIFCVAVSRWPWQKKHTAFLTAHLGILMLLFGSWLTDRFGLDGSLRVEEGQTSGRVELGDQLLIFSDMQDVRSVKVPWIPPNVRFRPIDVREYGVTVDQFITHADADVSFVAADAPSEGGPKPALRVKLQGGPMRIIQDFWLWRGHPSWSAVQAGPAKLRFDVEGQAKTEARSARELVQEIQNGPGPQLRVVVKKSGAIAWEARSSEGKVKKGSFASAAKMKGQAIEPGWRGGVKITFEEFVPDATVHTEYKPSRIQYGPQAPTAAVHLVAGKGGRGSEVWLGLGERAALQIQGRDVAIGFMPRMIQLPFGVRLDRFNIDHYEGTANPMSYSSRVTVQDARDHSEKQALISMNEPLEHRGITVYQASYEDGEPRPTVSIFSINQDPGRWLKYIGSLLIVGGSILLFVERTRKKGPAKSHKKSDAVEAFQ